ncbi:Hypp3654 [Branchiostoma lanceolatum]|uniref:Hypp3654 protein n=2 Tax=Branchiostoma lanceolatum TaxID=7740 RepID=A0A8K0A0I4_BRALA|nr:Hypp3654 [Branchiostoma lanceolatum]
MRVLGKGLNFAITPRSIPVKEIVTATEVAAIKLDQEEASLLRNEVVGILQNAKPPKPNLSNEERQAIKSLKENKDIVIIPADKGKAVVVMDKTEYVEQCEKLLDDKDTYKVIGPTNPTKKLKGRLQRKLRKIKKAGHLDQKVYDIVYPTSDATPRFYATPKIHKDPLKMRPIVSGINSITYHLARHLADLLKPLVGQTAEHIKNSKDLVTKVKGIKLEDGEVLTSFDVTALFTSVPGEEVVQMATRRAEADLTWKDRTLLTPEEFGELLLLVVSTTYFQYNGAIYEQTYGMAMGSPLSPVLANLFMEEFERKALDTAPHRPKFWGRYVDDTGVVNQREHEQELFEHINKQHDSIKFTIEKEKDGRLPMLDVMMIRNPDNSITTDVYRKETHTDQYLQWSSNHPVHQKLGIVRTLMHRADTLIEDPTLRAVEKEKVREALRHCGYPEWALKEGDNSSRKNATKDHNPQNKERRATSFAVLPYIKGVSERLKRAYAKHNVSLFSKPGYTLRNALVRPKDPLVPSERCGVIYKISCEQCGEVYVGETERSLGERTEEHQKSVDCSDGISALSQHELKTKHRITNGPIPDIIEIIDLESRNSHRKIKEAVHIQLERAGMNRTGGWELPKSYLPLLRKEAGEAGRSSQVSA